MKYVCFKYPRNKITDVLICFICIFLIILVFQFDASIAVGSDFNSDLSLMFLNENGWIVDDSLKSVENVLFEFEDIHSFNEYKEIQLLQGFDITPYINKTVEKHSYRVLNFPGYINDESVYANVFLFENKIIAADICSVKLDGFLQGAIVNENKIG